MVFLFAWFPKVQIIGDSMLPTYREGEEIRARRILRVDPLKVNDVYVFKEPVCGRPVIKRLSAVCQDEDGNTLCYFEGDNSSVSFDSRNYGWVSRKRIIAKALFSRDKSA